MMLRSARLLNRGLRRLGLQLVRHPRPGSALDRRARLLRHLGTELVLDVGANAGQYGQLLRQTLHWGGRICSFEPLPEAFARLKAAARGDPCWEVHEIGLAERDGPAHLHVAANSESSSLLPMLPAHLASAPESRYVAEQVVTLRRLDGLFAELDQGERQVWLKIDTQGLEHRVLEGASACLHRIGVIQLEMSLCPLYEGAPVMAQTLSLLDSLGYRCVGLEPGFADAQSGQLLQVDGIFLRQA